MCQIAVFIRQLTVFLLVVFSGVVSRFPSWIGRFLLHGFMCIHHWRTLDYIPPIIHQHSWSRMWQQQLTELFCRWRHNRMWGGDWKWCVLKWTAAPFNRIRWYPLQVPLIYTTIGEKSNCVWWNLSVWISLRPVLCRQSYASYKQPFL